MSAPINIQPIEIDLIDTILWAMEHQVTVWYDGACLLCLREIAIMRRLDQRGAINFVDVSGSAAENCPIDQAQLLKRFHASEGGDLLSGAAAFAAMWRAIPLLRPLGLLAHNRMILGALERLYTLFLRHRPKLQQWVARKQQNDGAQGRAKKPGSGGGT